MDDYFNFDFLPGGSSSFDYSSLLSPEYSSPNTNFFDFSTPLSNYQLPLFDWTDPSTYSSTQAPVDPLAGLDSYSLPGVPALTDYSNWGNPVGLDTTDWNQYFSDPSLWDQISGGADKLGGLLGTAWDKLTAGSGANGSGPSLLSQLGSLGLGGLGMYGNYQQNEFNKDLETRRLDQSEAQLGLSRDNTMLAQQQARINAATDMAKTAAMFDIIKNRQGVDLAPRLGSWNDQILAQGWSPNQGLAPVTSALGQFGVTANPSPRAPNVPAPGPSAAPTFGNTGSVNDRAVAFAGGGEYAGGGEASRGALGLLAGGTPGQSDEVNARLSDGEYVMDADVVAALGDGNTAAGAKKLDQMRENIRAHKRSAGPKSIPPKAKNISSYLKG